MAYVKGKSGYVDIAGANGFTARVYWSETYDLNAGKSKISIDKILIQSATYGGLFYPGGSLSIDGTVVREMHYTSPATHSVYLNAGTSWWEISPIGSANAFPWVSGEIEHDADGSKVTVISLDVLMWRSDIGEINGIKGSATINLTDIPRASTATVPNFTMGQKKTISITRASDTFTHNLTVKLGGQSYQIATNVKTSYAWTPDVDTWAARVLNAASAKCTMVVDTYNGSTLLGSTEYSFTLYVPSTIVPSITGFSVTLVNSNPAINGWGVAVKGYTKLKWAITAEGAEGSTIKSYAFTAGSLKGSAASGTTGVLPSAATITPSATVKDSRGRTATAVSEEIVVYDYTDPTISSAEAYRCNEAGERDANGTNVRLSLQSNIAPVNGNNKANYQYRYKTVSGSYGNWEDFVSGAVVFGFSTFATYVIEMRVVDELGNTASTSLTITTREEWLHGKEGGKGAAFGKVAEEDDLLDVAWDLRVRGNLILDNPIGSDAEIDYPITVDKGGTGASTAIEALANLFALNLNHITDSNYYVNSGDDLNDYTTPGAYRISTGTIAGSLVNMPPYKSAGGRLIVTATSTGSAGLFQLIIFNTGNYQIWYRIRTSETSWGKWQSLGTPHSTYSDCRYITTEDGSEWINPPMMHGTEYRTTERNNNKVVYTKLVDCGTVTNGASVTYHTSTVYPIRYAAYTSAGVALPTLMEVALNSIYKAWVDVNGSKITAQFNTGYSSLHIYCQVWYTK